MILTSCSYFLTDHKNDYLKEKQTKSIMLPEDQASRPIVDYFPINTENNLQVGVEYEIPMPPPKSINLKFILVLLIILPIIDKTFLKGLIFVIWLPI